MRYLPNGNIEFLGRLDHQVKIRGFRIELGEIEAVLGKHPAIEEVIVLAREDNPGEKRLTAYMVVKNKPGPTHTELRAFLREKLPGYMIPSVFVPLDAFPLTANGKVDRGALPRIDGHRPELQAPYVEPQTEIERTIAAVWREVLNLEEVGIHDNFFELGGHSLSAFQAFSRLKSAFQLELPLRSIFEATTVADLAELVETVRWAARDAQTQPGFMSAGEEVIEI